MISSSVKRNGPADLGYDISLKQEGSDLECYETVERNNNINLMEDDLDLSSEFDLHTDDLQASDSGPDEESCSLSTIFQGEWPIDKTYWHDVENPGNATMEGVLQQDTESMMSFSSSTASSLVNHDLESEDHGAAKADVVYSLICMLQTHDKMEVTKMLQTMSNSKENCIAMSRSGCLPLLVQLLHDRTEPQTFAAYRQRAELRKRAGQILRNIVYSQPDDKKGRREARVLKLLEQVRDYCDFLKTSGYEINDNESARCLDELVPAVAALMKMSFDEEHRHAMCLLGGLHAIAELLEIDQEIHGCTNDPCCTMIRRYSGMALTNLTFGDGTNKALLCSMRPFMQALVMQLHSPSEELRQVTASVLRNLSWRADTESKKMLRDVGAVSILMKAAMEASKESTLKSILSALWNLSAHCSENKSDICRIDGALGFLVTTLSFKSNSKNLAVIENGGGILRNISSHIALQNEHRVTLRKHNCLQILLQHLKSPSLTVVSNACGTLWNLSARNPQDQQSLWEMGAVGMLKKLVNSKHKMISMGSSAALKNLLSAQLPGINTGLGLSANDYNSGMPSLHVRKQKMMNTEIDQSLSETYDNTDSPKSSPTYQGSRKKCNTDLGKSGSAQLRNQGIPQRITAKKPNAPISQSSINTDQTNIDTPDQQKDQNIAWTAKSNQYNKDNAKVQMRAVSEGRGTSTRNFHSNRYGSSGIQRPLSHMVHPNNVRPHSVPCKKDRSCIPSLSFSQSSCNRSNVCRANDVQGKTSSPKTGRKLNINKNLCTNFAQRMRNIKSEDAEHQDQPLNLSLKHLAENSTPPNLSPTCLPPKSLSDSRIPLPKLNNYVDESKPASGIPSYVPTTNIPIDTGHVSRRESSPKSFAYINNVQNEDSSQTSTLYNSSLARNSDQKMSPESEHPVTDLKDVRMFRYKYQPSHNNWQNDSEDNSKLANNDEVKSVHNVNPKLSSVPASTEYRYSFPPSAVTISPDTEKDLENFESLNCLEIGKDHHIHPNNLNPIISDNNSASIQNSRKCLIADEQNSDLKDKCVVSKAEHDTRVRETPLMFSRCSSLGSLSSFDQQSIHDDRSSFSDLSQLNGEDVSPSDLPDSPTCCLRTSFDDRSPFSSNYVPENVINSEARSSDTSNVGTLPVLLPPTESAMKSATVLPDKQSSHQQYSSKPQSTSHSSETNTLIKNDIKSVQGHIPAISHDNYSNSLNENKKSHRPSSSEEIITFNDTYKNSEAPSKQISKCSERQSHKPFVHLNTVSSRDQKLNENSSAQKVNQCKNNQIEENREDIETNHSSQLIRLSHVKSPTCKVSESLNILQKKKPIETDEVTYSLKKTNLQSDRILGGNKEPQQQKLSSQLHEVEANGESDVQQPVKKVLHNECSSEIKINQSSAEENNLYSMICENVQQGKEVLEQPASFDTEKIPDVSTEDVQSCVKDDDVCVPIEISLEAQKLAEDMLEAGVDSNEDMTVSTLSCLSDIDNARPPSVMADLGSLSLTNSEIVEGAKGSKISKLYFSSARKTSLLKELQISRLNSDVDLSDPSVKGDKKDLSGSLSMKSSSTSDILENLNPPSILDDMSFTASTGSLNSLESSILDNDNSLMDKITQGCESIDNSLNERLCEADIMVQMYTKELSHITGNCLENVDSPDEAHNLIQPNTAQAVCEALEDLTETACDTIASDVEFVDELPCDDENLGSETLLAPQLSSLNKDDLGEGSTENLTVTLTEDSPLITDAQCLESYEHNLQNVIACDKFDVLRENADLILNTLQDVCLSENSEFEGLASNDMLEDETLSLVSNESDEDSLSPDGIFGDKDGYSLGQKTFEAEKLNCSPKKTSLPLPTFKNMPSNISNRVPISNQQAERSRFGFGYSSNSVPSNLKMQNKYAVAENLPKPLNNERFSMPHSNSDLDPPVYPAVQNASNEETSRTTFDSRTFTKKKPSCGKNIPNISDLYSTTNHPKNLQSLPISGQEPNESYSTTSSPSMLLPHPETSPSKHPGPKKVINSKIACVWKNKPRSKSIADQSRNRTLQ